MLRPSVMSLIAKALDGAKGFSQEDFSLASNETAEGSRLAVTYRYKPEYQFTVTVVQAEIEKHGYKMPGYTIEGAAAPGRLAGVERVSFSALDSLIEGIRDWAARIHEELVAAPIARRIQAQQQQIEDILAEVSGFPEDFFSRDEADGIKAKLDELQTDMVVKLEQRDLGQQELKQKVDQLQTEISLLKVTLESLNKKGWAASLKVRVAQWSKDPDNVQLVKAGAELLKPLLLPPGSTG